MIVRKSKLVACAAVILLVAITATTATAQITYHVTFPNVVHHEAEIIVTISGLPPGIAEFRMSRSSPGRYAIHEFAKNVYNVRAVDGGGRELRITRPDPYQWNVSGHNGTVQVSYTLFADRAGGTYSQVDLSHAHLNIPATFMWVRGMDESEISVMFHPPSNSNWKVATQLVPTGEFTFTAPNLQYFMDSPTELSDFSLREWDVPSGDGGTSTIRLAVHHRGTESEVDEYADMTRRVVEQEIAVFGAPAPYDHGTYTFIADYLPWASGDGMEHRNSTILSSSGSLANNALGLLGTVSHEFFHSWNVERIRPRSLEPFDFERANMSGELWFAEGFTSYYHPLFIKRAGISSLDDYARQLGGRLNTVINSPGRAFFSPVEMSMQAPFVDAATAVDPHNRSNTFISYYTWGSVIGLNLDLTLRTRFDLTLDGYMRLVWENFGVPETPYTVGDLERALAEFTDDESFARDFFDRYIRGSEVPDYAELLAHAGLLLRPFNPGGSFLGIVNLRYDEDGATINSGTRIGSPLYEAGLDRRDRIISIGSRSLLSDDDWQAIKADHDPGDMVEIEFEQRGQHRAASLIFVDDPRLELVTYEAAGMEVTGEMREFRESWLGSNVR